MKMKRFLSCLFALLTVLPLAACGDPVPQADPPKEYYGELTGRQLYDGEYVKWQGRNYFDEENQAVWFNLSAAGFEVEFEGTELTAELMGEWQNEVVGQGVQYPYIGVLIDDETDPRAARREEIYMREATEYVLASNLAPGKHTVKVYKLSETSSNKLALVSLKTDGKILDAPAPAPLSIEFYGDSVTCGYGIDYTDQTSFSTDTENAILTYAYLTARMLGADFSMICASGWGMAHGLGDDSAVPDWFEYADIRSQEQWDNAAHTPDIVVINLGANDNQYILGNVSGPVDAAEREVRLQNYLDAYRSFIKKLLSVYGRETPVFCCYGTMGESNIYIPLENMIYDDFQDSGYPNVYPVKLSDGFGNGTPALHGHPNVKSNIQSADILVKNIVDYTEYAVQTENIRTED